MFFAIGAVGIGGVIGFFSLISKGMFAAQLGIAIFSALKWIAWVTACASGVFLTADCLSEEKREGTLGLLFLTDLRGFDVVIGKLFATSLRSFYGLLAIFPVMALSFVMGGVGADDFQHTIFSICNALFFSLALGMAVSVIGRDTHKVMTATLAVMLVFLLAVPKLDSWVGHNPRYPGFELLSPVYTIVNTSSYRSGDFWKSIFAVHATGWAFLIIASVLASRTWHEKRASGGWRLGRRLFPDRKRPALTEAGAVCWIISRDRWAAALARLAVLFAIGILALSIFSLSASPRPGPVVPPPKIVQKSTKTTGPNSQTYSYSVTASSSASMIAMSPAFVVASSCSGFLSFLLEFWLVLHVSRFYVEGRRNGFLELLLVTPVQPRDVVKGQWLALQRLFLVPVAAQVFLSFAVGAIPILAGNSLMGVIGSAGGKIDPAVFQFLALLLGAASWTCGMVALAWFAIWMGLSSRKATAAVVKAFCFVKILPWVVVGFCVGLLSVPIMMGSFLAKAGPGGWFWLFPILPPFLMIIVSYILIRIARSRVPLAFTRWIAAPY